MDNYYEPDQPPGNGVCLWVLIGGFIWAAGATIYILL